MLFQWLWPMGTTMITPFSLPQVRQTHSENTAPPERPKETSASSAEAPKKEITEFDLLQGLLDYLGIFIDLFGNY